MGLPGALRSLVIAGIATTVVLAVGQRLRGPSLPSVDAQPSAGTRTRTAPFPTLRCAARTRPAPQHPSSEGPRRAKIDDVAEDPWLPAVPATEEAGAAETEAKACKVWRANVPDEEGLRLGRRVTWTQDKVAAGAEDLVIYDVSDAARHAWGTRQSIAWFPELAREACVVSEWGSRFAALLLEIMGSAGWPPETTYLGWDPKNHCLLVRQSAGGLRQVEALLDRFAAVGQGATRIHVKHGSRQVVVDVPWNGEATACAAREHTYVADYDIEVSQSEFIVGPLLGQASDGLLVSARGILGRGGDDDRLDIQLVAPRHRPPFERFEFESTGLGRCELEVAWGGEARWRGRLAAIPGTRTAVELDDGSRAEITVVGVVGALPSPRHTWRRIEPDGEWEAALELEEVLGLTLTRRGDDEELRGTIPLSGTQLSGSDRLQSEPAEPWRFDPDRTGALMPNDAELQAAAGGIEVQVSRGGSACERATFDVCVSIGRPTESWRETHALWSADSFEKDYRMRLRLPSLNRAVTSRRIVLPPRGVGTITFEVDLGEGLEVFDLALERIGVASEP